MACRARPNKYRFRLTAYKPNIQIKEVRRGPSDKQASENTYKYSRALTMLQRSFLSNVPKASANLSIRGYPAGTPRWVWTSFAGTLQRCRSQPRSSPSHISTSPKLCSNTNHTIYRTSESGVVL